MSKPAPRPIADLTSPQLLARGPALQGRAAAAGGVMTDSEIIALAWRYYKAGRASTAEADGIPTRDESIANHLVLAIRAGCVARERVVRDLHTREMVRREATGTGRARTVARPVFLRSAVGSIAASIGDCERAAELVDAAFVRGFRERYLDDWTRPAPTEEERHLWALLSTEPTSVDDGGVRKRRQRAVKWFEKQGRVVKKRKD
jgi:hypothetical protein